MTDDAPIRAGLYPVLTRLPYADTLLASPSEYDVAPTYLSVAFQQQGDQVQIEVARRTAEVVADRVSDDSIRKQLRIAVELTAPIGLGVVRSAALARTTMAVMLGANPVVAVLAGPALFLTARKTLQDMRRALVVDPKVRGMIQRAQHASEAGDARRAESLLEEALELELDPAYRRNSDLYLHLGLVQMQGGRPRKAMVSLAKASVLTHEDEVLSIPRPDGTTASISKRGWTELMACAAIDSFAVDESSADEWSEILSDFARSAEKRFETIARSKDDGWFFGLLGLDRGSADFGRELAAKARFLVAKANVRKLATSPDSGMIDDLLDGAVRELLAAKQLEPEERYVALLEQAQFYASIAHSSTDTAVDNAIRAVRLMDAGATQLDPISPERAAQTRAEAIAFALEIMPGLVGRGEDVEKLREATLSLATATGAALSTFASGASLAHVGRAWLEDVRYQLAENIEARKLAIRASYQTHLDAGEPAAAMYAALRAAYLAETREDTSRALSQLAAAAKQVQGQADLVSAAFAGKYLLLAMEVTGESPSKEHFATAAQEFIDAANAVSDRGTPVPLTLRGRRVLHSAAVADSVLRQHAASMLARSGDAAGALALLECVRAGVGVLAPASVRRIHELELAETFRHLGYVDRARELAERAEKEARGLGDPNLQRRALEILHALNSEPVPSTVDRAFKLDGGDGGWLGDYVSWRQLLVQAGRELVSSLIESNVPGRLHGSSDVADALAKLDAELERVAAERFDLGVVGEFSAGKSTFINALLGEAILPSSVRPTTSAPNRIHFGRDAALKVVYTSGREDVSNLETLNDFVTERGNPANEKGISHVEIAYPSPLLESGLRILDTPGLSSLFDSHDEVTRRAIPLCDAVIVLAPGRQPFTASLEEFLEGLGSIIESRTFYVLNKIDQVDVDRRLDAITFAKEQMRRKRPGIKVIAVSAYRALAARRLVAGSLDPVDLEDDPRVGDERDPAAMLAESNFERLEAELGSFLSRHRGIPRLRATARRLSDLVHRIELALATEQRATRLEQSQRLDAFHRLTRETATAKREIDDALIELTRRLASDVSEVSARARLELPERVDEVIDATQPRAADLKNEESRAALSDRIRAAVEAAARQWLGEAAQQLNASLAERVAGAAAILSRHRRELRVEFGRAVGFESVAAGIDTSVVEVNIAFSNNQMGRIAVEWTGWFLGGLLGGGVGGVLFGGAIGAALSKLVFGTDADVTERLRDALRPTVRNALESVCERICGAIEQSGSRQNSVAHEALDAQRRELISEFENRLASLVADRRHDDAVDRELSQLLTSVQDRAATARRVARSVMEIAE